MKLYDYFEIISLDEFKNKAKSYKQFSKRKYDSETNLPTKEKTKDEQVRQERLKKLLKIFFTVPGFRLPKRNIVIPFNKSANAAMKVYKGSDVDRLIIQYFEKFNFEVDTDLYLLGIIKNDKGKEVSILNTLKEIKNYDLDKLNKSLEKIDNPEFKKSIRKKIILKQQFREEYLNRASLLFDNKEYKIVFTWVPRKIASQSTDTGWTSCMNLYGGSNNHTVFPGINNGAFIAWLVKPGDEYKLDNPIARVLIKPATITFDSGVELFWTVAEKVYGTAPDNFRDKVKEFISEKLKNYVDKKSYDAKEYQDYKIDTYNDYDEISGDELVETGLIKTENVTVDDFIETIGLSKRKGNIVFNILKKQYEDNNEFIIDVFKKLRIENYMMFASFIAVGTSIRLNIKEINLLIDKIISSTVENKLAAISAVITNCSPRNGDSEPIAHLFNYYFDILKTGNVPFIENVSKEILFVYLYYKENLTEYEFKYIYDKFYHNTFSYINKLINTNVKKQLSEISERFNFLANVYIAEHISTYNYHNFFALPNPVESQDKEYLINKKRYERIEKYKVNKDKMIENSPINFSLQDFVLGYYNVSEMKFPDLKYFTEENAQKLLEANLKIIRKIKKAILTKLYLMDSHSLNEIFSKITANFMNYSTINYGSAVYDYKKIILEMLRQIRNIINECYSYTYIIMNKIAFDSDLKSRQQRLKIPSDTLKRKKDFLEIYSKVFIFENSIQKAMLKEVQDLLDNKIIKDINNYIFDLLTKKVNKLKQKDPNNKDFDEALKAIEDFDKKIIKAMPSSNDAGFTSYHKGFKNTPVFKLKIPKDNTDYVTEIEKDLIKYKVPKKDPVKKKQK